MNEYHAIHIPGSEEFMSDLTAVTRAVGPGLANCELTFVAREPIDLAKASEQHVAYCDALREVGLSVRVLATFGEYRL